MSENIVEGYGLSKQFRLGKQVVRALDSVDVEIPEGQFALIMGASGSGKSSLLYALTGLDIPTTGQVYVAGQRLDRMNQTQLAVMRSRMIGFVFQGFYLVPSMSAVENVMLSGLFANHSKEERYKRAAQLLKTLNMADRLHHRPNELSGGQQQRVAIARALYNDPPIIVADEPTGALDSKTGSQIMKMLRQLCSQEGKTILVVSHDPSISQYADRMIRLRDGQIVEDKLKAEKQQ